MADVFGTRKRSGRVSTRRDMASGGRRIVRTCRALLVLVSLGFFAMVAVAEAHPMGNFSISRYSGLTIEPEGIMLRYLVDMAEIPTFQEIQEAGIVAEAGHPSLDAYLMRKAEHLAAGLALEVNGQRLALRNLSRTVRFTPGAGDLPTMKLGLIYRATAPVLAAGLNQLDYHDANFPDRAGWKEVVAEAAYGLAVAASSVPERDRSRELSDYPTDLMNSPPQTVRASLTFAVAPPPITASAAPPPSAPPIPSPRPLPSTASHSSARPLRSLDPSGRQISPLPVKPDLEESRATGAVSASVAASAPLDLQPNRQLTRGNRFTDLIASGPGNFGMLVFAALVAATLGAFHALEPGHGKTVVAAYLVGARGTARHAMLLGLIVTTSHTAGVYLLGLVTLYASHYVVPERIYPWLGALSGLTIAGLGICLFVRRYRTHDGAHDHLHAHDTVHGHFHPHDATDHDHSHHSHEGPGHHHGHDDHHRHSGHHHHHHVPAPGAVTLRSLLVLGITGGIVPCPAALVVLLSAVALGRVGFGLFLIVAFSVGLAGVLIGIGLVMVYARRLMTRVEGHGPLVTRWLPLTSSATIAVLGVAIATQALMAGGILSVRLG